MEQFMTWEMLGDYAMFVLAVFSIVAVTKNAWIIKKVPTRAWSIMVSFLLLVIVNLRAGTFGAWDVVMYFINAILISLNANGLADINKAGEKNESTK